MNSYEFKQEVLDSKICPQGFNEIYEEFNKYQKMAADALIEFHRVCEINNIPYQLAFGSLLGAIRDGGQIPWDYDVDVFIYYNDRTRLIEALEHDLSKDFYLDCYENNPRCQWFFMRVAPRGYDSELLHVDIYQLFGTPENEIESQSFLNIRNNLTALNRIKRCSLRDQELVQGGVKKQLGMLRAKIKNIGRSKAEIIRDIENLQSKYSLSDSVYCSSICSVYKQLRFPTDYIAETEIIETSIGKLRVSTKAEMLLQTIYGDYHKIYPLENRLYEMLNSYYRIKGKKRRLGSGTRYYYNQ